MEAVIIIDDADDKKEVAKTQNNAEVKEEHVIVDVPNQHVTHIILISLYFILYYRIHSHITNYVTSRTNYNTLTELSLLCKIPNMFDEEEDEDKAENKNPWEFDDEVADEDEIDNVNEVDDEDE
ncbi:hypothetical protein Tco_0247569 [Tanacetum coccineum]